MVPEWVCERGWHPPHLAKCRVIEAMGPLGQLVRARQWGKAISTREGLSWNHPCSAVTQTSAGLTKGVGVDVCPQSQPHPQKEMEMLQTNPSNGGSAVPSLSKRDSKLSGGRQGTCPHSLRGHGLFLEGDEGHSQGLVLDPAFLLCDPLHQPVLHARVVGDGVLLPEDTSPCDDVVLCRSRGTQRPRSRGVWALTHSHPCTSQQQNWPQGLGLMRVRWPVFTCRFV